MRSHQTRAGLSGTRGYLAAVVGVALAAAAQLGLMRLVGPRYPFSLFYGVILLTAWNWGLGPGLLAMALGAVLVWSAVLGPAAEPGSLLVGLALYLGFGSAILLIGESNRRVVARLRREVADRRRAEEALRESEGWFRRLADLMPQIVWTAAPDGSIESFNGRFYRYTGMEQGSSPGRDAWRAMIHPDDLALLDATRAEALARGGDFEDEFRLRRVDGTYRWHLVRSVPVRDRSGRVVRRFGTATDIDDRRRAEEALRASEQKYRCLAEGLPLFTATADADGTYTYLNDRWLAFTGLDLERTNRGDWADLIHPDDREALVRHWAASIRAGRPFEVDYRIRAAGTDAHRWHLARATPLHDAEGTRTGWVVAAMDIHDRKESEEALRRSEERFQLVTRATSDSLWDLDWVTGELWWQERHQPIFGYRPDQVDTRLDTWLERIHPEDRPAVEEGFRSCVTRRDPIWVCEYRFRRADGSYAYVLDRGCALYDAQGRCTRMVGAMTDLTERKRFEQALQESDRRKDEFLATLAHELRNPLVPIRNALPVLAGSVDEADRASTLEMIGRQVRTMSRLIDDLMDVSRINRGRIELHPEPVELGQVVRRAIESARPTIAERGHALSVRLPEAPIATEGDPTRLEQVVWNLLNNAAKYTEPGGRIEVGLERDGDAAGLTVRDTGIGIDPGVLPTIFGMFVQAESGPGRSHDGLGIGLGLVQTLVELHGGTISAESDGPGRGSTFAVRLPVRSPSAEAAPAPAPTLADPESAGPPRLRVLVVDDNRDVAASQARLLRRLYGQEVAVAHDGPSALEAARSFRPDLVLLDLGMPGMDGHEVARRLRDDPELPPFRLVAVTGWGQEADRRRSREAGFDEHLVKPVEPEALLRLLLAPTPAARESSPA